MPDYVSRVCLGELNQHVNNGNYDLSSTSTPGYSRKTAALFEASFVAGAVLSMRPFRAQRVQEAGALPGMIFQLTDDCMDFEADERVARKPVQST